ncbi:MAG: transglycosylase family protein [Acidimicrobiia bacterium]
MPYDPDSWLPVPDPSALPSLEDLSLDALVSPSPARAEPHDPAAWLPLPDDLGALPSLDELLAPSPEVRAAVIEDAEAVVREAAAAAEAVVAPSPARAEPHDAAAWLPVPDPHTLVTIPELAAGFGPPARPRERRRVARNLASLRSLLLVLLVAATIAVGVQVVNGNGAPAVRAASFRITVDVDGVVRTVSTTERSAQGLMRTLHVGKLVAVRNIPGRLHVGSEVVLRTRHNGVLAVDGQMLRFDSASRTVDELLASYKVVLSGDDYIQPAHDALLANGQTITVTRVGDDTKQRFEKIPFTEEQQPDPNINIGETSLLRAGVNGTTTITYRERIENGVAVATTILSKVRSREPVSRIVGYGTKADWHWDALAACESGGRWSTIDGAPGGYDGGLGIARSTWAVFGGREFAPIAGQATREEQITVGERIYAAHGWSAWGCARNALHW